MRLNTDSITIANAAHIVAAGQAAMRAGDFTIDFSEVVRCDTSAVACVLDWLRFAQADGRKIQFIALPKDLLSLAKLYNVEGFIEAR
jgi:phospholipid transport system transporter-binding protein